MSAKFSGERTPSDDPAFKPIRELQLAAYYNALEYVEGRRVLEIGCGEGIGTSILATKAASVLAVDHSEEALRAARTRCNAGNLELALMRVPPIDLADGSFDGVICFQMIEHLEEPDGLVVEIKRVLRDTGVALITTVNKEETITDNPYHLHEFSHQELQRLLEDHFGGVEMYGVFGDELFMRYREDNRKWVNTLMRADIFNLSSRLPLAFKRRLYETAGRFMRVRLKRRDPQLCDSITHENFIFRPSEFTGCMDIFAVCRKTPS